MFPVPHLLPAAGACERDPRVRAHRCAPPATGTWGHGLGRLLLCWWGCPPGFPCIPVLPSASPCFLLPDQIGAAGTERCLHSVSSSTLLLLPQAPLLRRLLPVQDAAANTNTRRAPTQGASPPLHHRPLRPHGRSGPGFLALWAGDRVGDRAGDGDGAGRWFPVQAARHSLTHRARDGSWFQLCPPGAQPLLHAWVTLGTAGQGTPASRGG